MLSDNFRPQEGGRQFQLSSTSSLGSLESELVTPNVIRNTRNQQNVNEESNIHEKILKKKFNFHITDWSWWNRVHQLSWDSSLQAEKEVPSLWPEEKRGGDHPEQKVKTVTLDTAGPCYRQSNQVRIITYEIST